MIIAETQPNLTSPSGIKMNDSDSLDIIDIPVKLHRPPRTDGPVKKVTPAWERQVETIGCVIPPGWPAILDEARLHLARALHQARAEDAAEALARITGAIARAAAQLVALEKLAAAELSDLSTDSLKDLLKGILK
jgi:hypothetical protein